MNETTEKIQTCKPLMLTVKSDKLRLEEAQMFWFCRFFVVIGAPKANTSQPGVTEGGGVFLCTWSPDGACDIIDFDPTGEFMPRMSLGNVFLLGSEMTRLIFTPDVMMSPVSLSCRSQVMRNAASQVSGFTPLRAANGSELLFAQSAAQTCW